ncbi:hypothetical protein [Streptomyces chartreusis]|uniref:hypothetical protein n=1 Tax=Streptomyces chartreusis TaxID=1969 RepID=UPI0038025112
MSLALLRASAAGWALTMALSAGLLPSGTAHAKGSSIATASPFTEPAFSSACTWHEFGEGEKPPWWLLLTDPLCVEYQKRDITSDNGGVIRFLAAEPARFAVTLLTCHYYQKDHWSVQSTTGASPWVAWDGQYWWDKSARRAGARLTNLRIHGHTVGIGDAVAALRPVFPNLADALSDYGQMAGETGITADLPYDPRCTLRR